MTRGAINRVITEEGRVQVLKGKMRTWVLFDSKGSGASAANDRIGTDKLADQDCVWLGVPGHPFNDLAVRCRLPVSLNFCQSHGY